MSTPVSSGPFAATDRLAQRVLGGAVVFFVGAGFSLSSEGNTAGRLIARLLARLLAMGTGLSGDAEEHSRSSQAGDLLDGLGSVFNLNAAKRKPGEERQPARCMTADNVALLAREYYTFNEWSSSALGVLSREVLDLPANRRTAVWARIHKLERFLLASLGKDSVPLDDVDWTVLSRLEQDTERGKALFLDTMGFANPAIMGGDPGEPDLDLLEESYRGRLRPRHHALARLAREGLLPCLVTTNYDLLLEGAYRVAGFQERECLAVGSDHFPTTAVPSFSRIAGADQFFSRGENYRTALLLKIHGCADNYRTARAAAFRPQQPAPRLWTSYLPALVFTYREIQTWRADAWSRDLLRTLLRTNTLVLCGYSGADPVMHSTFREVYEEMAQLRAGSHPDRTPEDAPLFFFDVAGKQEFHGFEILRAATEAAGRRKVGAIVEHPNHVQFVTAADGFPTVDDHLRWLLHRVLRELQVQALGSRLRYLTRRLLGGPCPETDYVALVKAFQDQCRIERDQVSQASSLERRRVFESVVGWTWHFLPGLVRELALAELVDNQQGPGRLLRSLRRGSWYFPATERLEWTAWAAVVELALRRMVTSWRGGRETDDAWKWIAAEDSPYAAISLANEGARQPLALCIRLAGFGRPGRPSGLTGAYRRVTTWELGEHDVPWRTSPEGTCPAAATLWDSALGKPLDSTEAAFYLGAA